MVICIEKWRTRIGLFVARSTKGKFKVYNVKYITLTFLIIKSLH